MKLRRYRRQPRAADGVLLGFDSLPIAEAIGDSITQTTEDETVDVEHLKELVEVYGRNGRDACRAAIDTVPPDKKPEFAKIAADLASMLEGGEKSEDKEREQRVAGGQAAYDAVPGLRRIGC